MGSVAFFQRDCAMAPLCADRRLGASELCYRCRVTSLSPKVHVLDDALADQIAAGEVVERPASVVKELLENSLDAGARAVTVEVAEGGVARIRIVDDGEGMVPEDAALAVRRHATSKLRRAEDLEAIATLGFRGEALPSIASVSRFRLVTRPRDAVEGTEVFVEAGAPARVSPAGCAPGTIVEVTDLLHNMPARRKFLKSRATESAHITEVCVRAALTRPELRLTLIRDGKKAREYLPASDWEARARQVVGGPKLLRIEGERAGLRVRALLGAPEDARSGAGGLHMFVNGRPVRDRALARSVAFAYGSVMPPGRYPVGVVHLDLDPAEVDVNVHPQKAEVRFARGREVLDHLTRLLAHGLGTAAWQGPTPRRADFWNQRLPAGPLHESSPQPGVVRESASPDPWGLSPETGEPLSLSVQPAPPSTPQQAALPATDAPPGIYRSNEAASRAPRLRALGQMRNLFIVAEGPTGMVVMDQHAAHERVTYHRLREQHRERRISQQRLLLPERVDVSEAEAGLVERHPETVSATGLEVSVLGPTTVAVHAVPALLHRAAPERLLRDLLDELSRAGERNFTDAVDMALATMACHGSIRAGDSLSLPECQALLDELAGIGEFAGHCPHGRPIVFEMGFGELERKVGR